MSKEIENIADIEDILGSEDSEIPEVELPGSEEEPIEKEIEEEPELDENGNPIELKEIEGEELNTIRVKDVTKKYPNFFKDFPDFRHILFHEREYRELFPTIEEAKESIESLEGFRELETAISEGGEQNVKAVLDAFTTINDSALPDFASNFLPALRKLDSDTYIATITPILVESIRNMYDAGIRNENANLQNTALVAALHMFGDQKIATGEREIKSPARKVVPEKDSQLEREKREFRTERYTTFYNDVVQNADSRLLDTIKDGIDPRGKMTESLKDLISERVSKEIAKVLSSNKIHSSKMDALWKKAGESNFSGVWKSKILSAYLDAAGQIMPKIRAKVRATTLGIRDRQPETNGGRSEKREPKLTTGGGGSSNRSNSNGGGERSSKEIDWRKTSDQDLFNDKITYKK